MLTSLEIIKLYLILNKLMYKHAELGRVIYNTQRNPDVDNPDFKILLELSLAIDLLLEASDSVVLEGNSYPYYGDLSGREFQHLTDFLSSKYELDPLPNLDFPKNTTKYIASKSEVNIGGSGTELPQGGGVGFYLTKNVSGQLVWNEIKESYPTIATKTELELSNLIYNKGQLIVEGEYSAGKLIKSRIKIGDGISTYTELPYSSKDEYPYNELTTIDIGGISKDTDLQGESIVDILKALLTPYVKPEFTAFTANDKTKLTYEIGTPLPNSFNVKWNISNLINVSDTNTGIISSSDINAFTNLGNVNLTNLVYTLNSASGFTYNIPDNFELRIQGIDTNGSPIPIETIDFEWLSRIRWGVRSQSSITSSAGINSLTNTLLTDTLKRTYNFTSGYIFIAVPEYLSLSGLKFIDADNNLGFSMALQSEFDSSLPSTVSYNNGNTTFNYQILRGEFFYNSNINIRIE